MARHRATQSNVLQYDGAFQKRITATLNKPIGGIKAPAE
jgi:hypothetical protein